MHASLCLDALHAVSPRTLARDPVVAPEQVYEYVREQYALSARYLAKFLTDQYRVPPGMQAQILSHIKQFLGTMSLVDRSYASYHRHMQAPASRAAADEEAYSGVELSAVLLVQAGLQAMKFPRMIRRHSSFLSLLSFVLNPVIARPVVLALAFYLLQHILFRLAERINSADTWVAAERARACLCHVFDCLEGFALSLCREPEIFVPVSSLDPRLRARIERDGVLPYGVKRVEGLTQMCIGMLRQLRHEFHEFRLACAPALVEHSARRRAIEIPRHPVFYIDESENAAYLCCMPRRAGKREGCLLGMGKPAGGSAQEAGERGEDIRTTPRGECNSTPGEVFEVPFRRCGLPSMDPQWSAEWELPELLAGAQP